MKLEMNSEWRLEHSMALCLVYLMASSWAIQKVLPSACSKGARLAELKAESSVMS